MKTTRQLSRIATVGLALVLPPLATAQTWDCAGGDVPCLIATLAKIQQAPDRPQTLRLGPGTFTLTRPDNEDDNEGGNGLPSLMGRVTIQGAGPGVTIIERAPGSPFFRLFMILDDAEVRLEGLTVQGGALDPDWFYRAGGIANHGHLTFVNSVSRSNSAWLGGGIGNDGVLHVVRSTIEENAAEFVAGGIANTGRLLVEDSWIAANVAEEEAGLGIGPAEDTDLRGTVVLGNIATLNTGGGMGGVCKTCRLVRSLFIDNYAGGRGGAINLDDGRLELQDVVLVGNTAEFFGGGLAVERGEVEAERTAIVGNTARFGPGGGILQIGGAIRLRQSIVVGNHAARNPDCSGAILLEGRSNVVGNREGCTVTQE